MKETQNTQDVKIYAHRDSATALLRKLGVKAADYTKFIKLVNSTDGSFVVHFQVNVKEAKSSLNGAVAADTVSRTPIKTKKLAAKTIELQEPAKRPETVSSFMRRRIAEGARNSTIFAEAKLKFGLDNSKKYYPAWYRSKMARAGEVK